MDEQSNTPEPEKPFRFSMRTLLLMTASGVLGALLAKTFEPRHQVQIWAMIVGFSILGFYLVHSTRLETDGDDCRELQPAVYRCGSTQSGLAVFDPPGSPWLLLSQVSRYPLLPCTYFGAAVPTKSTDHSNGCSYHLAFC